MRVGYAKLGRTTGLDPAKWGPVGGDVDVYRFLYQLAAMHPDWEFRVVGRNAGVNPQSVGLPANVTNPWDTLNKRVPFAAGGAGTFKYGDQEVPYGPDARPLMQAYVHEAADLTWHLFEDLDAIIIWAGQHGTTNYPIPPVKGEGLTSPYVWALNYGGYLLQNINRWRSVDPVKREEIWLCPDPRNYLKMRDLKYPLTHPVLGQFDMRRQLKHEQYDGSPVIVTQARYIQSGLEMTPCPAPSQVQVVEGTELFGIVINETRKEVGYPRKKALKDWVLDQFGTDVEVRGTWSERSREELGIAPEPVAVKDFFDVIGRWRYTITTPPSGSGWITTKPFEMFARGVVCFFHPKYDTQNAGLAGAPDELKSFLRVQTPLQMRERITAAESNPDLRRRVVEMQREHYERRWQEAKIHRLVEARIAG